MKQLLKDLFFFGIFCLVLLFTVFGPLRALQVRLASPAWDETTGEILMSRVVYSREKYSRDDYKLDVKYRYTVAGEVYEGKGITFIGGKDLDGTKPEMEALRAAEFPVGQRVTVYYAPDDPSYAALSPESTYWRIFGVLAMCVLFLLCTVWYFIARVQRW